jgi:hypothetical protein
MQPAFAPCISQVQSLTNTPITPFAYTRLSKMFNWITQRRRVSPVRTRALRHRVQDFEREFSIFKAEFLRRHNIREAENRTLHHKILKAFSDVTAACDSLIWQLHWPGIAEEQGKAARDVISKVYALDEWFQDKKYGEVGNQWKQLLASWKPLRTAIEQYCARKRMTISDHESADDHVTVTRLTEIDSHIVTSTETNSHDGRCSTGRVRPHGCPLPLSELGPDFPPSYTETMGYTQGRFTGKGSAPTLLTV